ncbi:LacI family transcriptional regulator [Burkholderia anthina]|uniref:LacI family DNA-binding transcriptional regulator n=1 Tax=Burkholderia anthina TaxID=179879 RepID=UPI001CF27EDA|nr:LacI family DNA-binding transcriptional regulator [Burkholderia anthina]MCA8095251.1 LacI family transcriptional regulator [Burkholderia anthina]
MVTLVEVARRAGVTAATVSNVLRNRGRVGAETRARVLAAVEALGYRPNLTARALVEGYAPMVALVVSSIANPFYPEFALAVEQALRRNGQYLIVCNTNADVREGRTYLDQIAGTLAEGVLVASADIDPDDLERARSRGVPVVVCMWERPSDPPGKLPCVAIDFRLAGRLAAEHLLELGHRRIGIIVGASAQDGVHKERFAGFVDALAAMRVSALAVECTTDSIAGGEYAVHRLLGAHPDLTAIFATNDLPAIGAMHAALDMGRRVPDDLSLIGITDISLAKQVRPALSTVAIPLEEAAALAVELLKAQRTDERGKVLEDVPLHARLRITTPPRLIVRGSTKAPR